MPTKLSNEIITAAIEGFESQKAQIDAQIAELRQMLSGRTGTRKTQTARHECGWPCPDRRGTAKKVG